MLSKKLRNVLVLLAVIPLFLLMLAWFLIIKPLAEDGLNSALNNIDLISKSNDNLSSNPFKVFFLGARSPATVTLNTKPIPIPLEQAIFEVSAFSLLRLMPKVSFTSNLFGGTLVGQASYQISSSAIRAGMTAKDIQISKYQLASMLGVTAGSISLELELQNNSSNQLSPSKLFFMLKDFSKPKTSKLPKWISPLTITIPAIERAEIVTEVSCGPLECKSSKLNLSSNLGQASGVFSFPSNGVGELKASITVALTQSGKNELLPYFALLNRELLSVPDKPFLIKISGPINKPKLTVVPIQNSL